MSSNLGKAAGIAFLPDLASLAAGAAVGLGAGAGITAAGGAPRTAAVVGIGSGLVAAIAADLLVSRALAKAWLGGGTGTTLAVMFLPDVAGALAGGLVGLVNPTLGLLVGIATDFGVSYLVVKHA